MRIAANYGFSPESFGDARQCGVRSAGLELFAGAWGTRPPEGHRYHRVLAATAAFGAGAFRFATELEMVSKTRAGARPRMPLISRMHSARVSHRLSVISPFPVQGSKFKVQSSRFKVQGSKFKVPASPIAPPPSPAYLYCTPSLPTAVLPHFPSWLAQLHSHQSIAGGPFQAAAPPLPPSAIGHRLSAISVPSRFSPAMFEVQRSAPGL